MTTPEALAWAQRMTRGRCALRLAHDHTRTYARLAVDLARAMRELGADRAAIVTQLAHAAALRDAATIIDFH